MAFSGSNTAAEMSQKYYCKKKNKTNMAVSAELCHVECYIFPTKPQLCTQQSL